MINLITKIFKFYMQKNRWWIPLLSGIPFAFSLPPFNYEFNPLFALFPLISFFSVVPLLFFATRRPFKKALIHSYLASYVLALSQCFWVAFVKIEGLWGIIIIGMFLLAGYVAFFYFIAGLIFRKISQMFPRLCPFVFPAFWILIDYSRTLSDLAFPWGFMGYNLTLMLPLSQMASITGVWGITYLIVLGNALIFECVRKSVKSGMVNARIASSVIIFTLICLIIVLWGNERIKNVEFDKNAKIAIMQPNLDQLNWGNYSIDQSFSVFDTLIYQAALDNPDLILGPESSLLCYLSRQRTYRKRVQKWADSTDIPILLGSLHWDKPEGSPVYEYLVYNTAFLISPGKQQLSPYRKIKLVPFSEIFPFEAKFPILSRVNLGEADFKRGKEDVVYKVNSNLSFAPYICYEIIFPNFVRRKLHSSVNLIVHITNDGWFGRTSGPYQHAAMTRMRAIENCVPIARCAITGISMFIDPVGNISKRTQLGVKDVITEDIGIKCASTFYSKYGDWFVKICFFTAIFLVILKPISKVLHTILRKHT